MRSPVSRYDGRQMIVDLSSRQNAITSDKKGPCFQGLPVLAKINFKAALLASVFVLPIASEATQAQAGVLDVCAGLGITLPPAIPLVGGTTIDLAAGANLLGPSSTCAVSATTIEGDTGSFGTVSATTVIGGTGSFGTVIGDTGSFGTVSANTAARRFRSRRAWRRCPRHGPATRRTTTGCGD
jgi:hypothetical protein